MRFAISMICLIAPSILLAAQGESVNSNVAYYYGAVVYLGPDGKTPYGKTISLVKRTIDPANDLITELVSQPDRSTPNKANDFETFIARTDGTSTLHVRDAGNTFSGTILFSGPDWAWNQWDYDLYLTAGGRIKGHGILDSNGITTKKQVMNDDGSISVLVNENLAPITADEYKVHRNEMFPSAP